MQRDQQPRLAPLMRVLICSDIHISQNHYDNRMQARSFNQSSFANFPLSSWTMLTTTHVAHKHASLYSSSSAVPVQVTHPTETLQPSSSSSKTHHGNQHYLPSSKNRPLYAKPKLSPQNSRLPDTSPVPSMPAKECWVLTSKGILSLAQVSGRIPSPHSFRMGIRVTNEDVAAGSMTRQSSRLWWP